MSALRLGAVILAGVIGCNASAAIADGMPPRGPDPYVYVAPESASLTYDWTGLYIGGNLGAATSKVEWSIPGVVSADRASNNGFAGGGFVGLQKQWSWLVFGAEVGYLWTGQSDVSTTATFPDTTFSSNVRDLLLVTGKLGWTYDRILAYFKGGWASGDVSFRTNMTSTGTIISSTGGRKNGWTAGVGLEYALWPHVIIGVEYDYVNFPDSASTQVVSALGPAGINVSSTADIQTVTARLSFKFGGATHDAAPVN